MIQPHIDVLTAPGGRKKSGLFDIEFNRYHVLGLIWLGLILTGCATPPARDALAYMPAPPVPPPPLEQRHGAIYHDNIGIALFEDSRARRIGDVLTIELAENTTASKKASTSTKKETDITSNEGAMFGSPISFSRPFGTGPLMTLGASLQGKQGFDGEGDSSLSNALNGRITVTVFEVMSNGYLRVRGEKRLTINHGDEYVQFSGIVRPSDIQADNSVVSTLVADAKITYTGEGDIADAQKMGFIARFFNKFWPY